MEEDDTEPQRCSCRCSLHPYIPCAVSPCVAHEIHRCVLCLPQRPPAKFKKGDRVRYTDRKGVVTALVVCEGMQMSLGWMYSCCQECDPSNSQSTYSEERLN